jgi:hypothetical protein
VESREWNSEFREWNPDSREWDTESREWNSVSKDLLDYLTWDEWRFSQNKIISTTFN